MLMTAHLNGGPKDDAYMNVDRLEVYVLGQVPLAMWTAEAEAEPMAPAYKQGVYRVRRDSLGQLVPHSLAGVVEFDWQGWL